MKRWSVETNEYELDVRMLDRNMLDEYSDIELIGHALYKKSDIYRIIDSSVIISVVGTLELAV